MGAMRSFTSRAWCCAHDVASAFSAPRPAGLQPSPDPHASRPRGLPKAFGSLEQYIVGEWLFHGPALPIVRPTPEIATSPAATSRKGLGPTRPEGNSARITRHCAMGLSKPQLLLPYRKSRLPG